MFEIFDYFKFDINTSDDPRSPVYFYAIIIYFVILLVVLKLISQMLHSSVKKESDLEATLLYNNDYSFEFIIRKNSLRFRYLFCYVVTKANVWAKSPYLWALYNRVHGFTVKEIGILYLVDNLSALIFGPITGNLADILGRKLFCIGYCLLIIVNLSLRLTGSQNLAYIAQVLTGISAALINTTFESWLNFEASKEFKNRLLEKERFLKKLFKMQTLFDAMMSVCASILAAVFYNLYGIKAPIIMAICVAFIGMTCIFFMWDENKPNSNSKQNFNDSFKLALNELKKREVLSIGLIEGLFQGVLTIFIFAWTPILELSSTNGEMNLGAVSICFVIMVITMTIIYEIFILHYGINLYLGLATALLSESVFFLSIYKFDSFYVRLILLSFINGLTGFVNPLNSIIKSKVLEEKYRALLMNIFRMPLNFYVVTVLLLLQYMDPMIICLICSTMVFLAFSIGLSMKIFPPNPISRKLSIPEEIDEILEEIIELEAASKRY